MEMTMYTPSPAIIVQLLLDMYQQLFYAESVIGKYTFCQNIETQLHRARSWRQGNNQGPYVWRANSPVIALIF